MSEKVRWDRERNRGLGSLHLFLNLKRERVRERNICSLSQFPLVPSLSSFYKLGRYKKMGIMKRTKKKLVGRRNEREKLFQ